MNTVHPNHAMISSKDVKNTRVFDPAATEIGNIDHLMIDKASGKISYAVMSFGGFLGMGQTYYPIPWPALTYSPDLGGYMTGITEKQVKGAPQFSDDAWSDRDWEKRTYAYYNQPPYW